MNTRHWERGQVIPLVAIVLTTILGFAGTSVDIGYWRYEQRQQQNVADSAAVGGAQALDAAGCPSATAAKAAAVTDAAMYGYAAAAVQVNNPPVSGPYAGNNCSVSVSVTGTKPGFFARLFGKGTITESTSATAQLVSTNNNIIYLTSNTSTSNFTGGSVNASGGGISCNGPCNFCPKSGTIDAARIGYAGSAPTVCGQPFSGATPAPQATAPNPCSSIPACTNLANNPPPISGCRSLQGNMNATLSPGCYNSLTMGSCGTVTLQPGLYILNGTSDFSNSSFVGTGVTFYVTANGTPPDFSSAHSATISPPTSGTYANVLYYQVASNTAAPNFSGSSVHWNGLLYAPGALGVNFDGAKGDYTVLVLGSANLNSSGAYTFGTPPPNSSMLQNVVLTQ